MGDAVVRSALEGHRHRVLRFELVGSGRKTARPTPPRRYRATIFDYDANRALEVEGSIAGKSPPKVRELDEQPLPSMEEWTAAVEVVRRNRDLAEKIRAGKLAPYRPMPLLVRGPKGPDGRPPRILTVGLMPPEGEPGHTIAGVDAVGDSLVEYATSSPPDSCAETTTCGVPDSGQTPLSYAAGQRAITVRDDRGTELWRFVAVRPAATEGNGAGIELKDVRYRGKLVLGSAGARIQNVNYEASAPCGHTDDADPRYRAYLDPTNREGLFQAPPGTDHGDGFRECGERPRTVFDGDDTGNFQGVVIYRDGSELVLITELEAGFYRYVNEWRLDDDGTIRPRFGWTAIRNCCVCFVHHHHLYWRFDFDIVTRAPNQFREYRRPEGAWEPFYVDIAEEKKDTRDATKLGWMVENVQTGDSYRIVPGPDDGSWLTTGHPFGDGDVWFLRQRPDEIEQTVAHGEPTHHANIDKWVSGESIDGEDVVMWYAVHSTHDQDPEASHVHLVGPDLVPSARW